jgi:hypothetical protein
VFGQWDSIAITEAKSLFELAQTIIGQVRSIRGIQDTTTLLQGALLAILYLSNQRDDRDVRKHTS